MSAELYCANEPGGNNASLQGTTVGGSKPLHRFIKWQPKIIGIVVLVLGSSFFIISIAMMQAHADYFVWTAIPPGFLLGTLFIICGILYILTDHNPTKKTVTMSLALSIVTILALCWTVLHLLLGFAHHIHDYNREYEIINEDNMTEIIEPHNITSNEAMVVSVEVIFLVYSVAGAITFIVMSCLAGAALRSTKSQAVIVMTTTPAETPVE